MIILYGLLYHPSPPPPNNMYANVNTMHDKEAKEVNYVHVCSSSHMTICVYLTCWRTRAKAEDIFPPYDSENM